MARDILLIEEHAEIAAILARHGDARAEAAKDEPGWTDDLFGLDGPAQREPPFQADPERWLHEQMGQARPGSPGPSATRERAQEARQERELKSNAQTVRDIYRKLASALHPDREANPDERRRKTALLRRANRAHDHKDLLELLNLQLEIALVGRVQMASLPDAQFAQFVRVLKRQLADVEHEIEQMNRPSA